MVHAVWVAIQAHIYAVIQEMGIFSTGITERLGFIHYPSHFDPRSKRGDLNP
jgi:hypothetical protein